MTEAGQAEPGQAEAGRVEPGQPEPGQSNAEQTQAGRVELAQVDLWLLDVRAPQPALDPAVLDAEERERAARFLREGDRVLYTVAHTALRAVLAARTGVPAADLRFERAPCPCCGALHGRPRLASADGPEFSLSHGGDLVLIGLAPQSAPIGVDVERLPGPETVRETTATLHPAERTELAAAAGGPSPEAFARIWTRKEAYLKALGTGLGREPSADYVGEADPAALPQGWTIATLDAGPTHAAAFAVAASAATFTFHEL
ncbi:4'-phosphopantetheinyl transferase family protein [Streptacidiphilus melanogenes]|uniref:4'-phosphopantetheinyl transferase family protein n=1 Tax=Streptacidiphilus melanogenes TaxID=411235 RepID=UPI000693409C|nr:4'-phosphopantetheinyl transferase superfamily protein [Streptacidiphilus melanogenes]